MYLIALNYCGVVIVYIYFTNVATGDIIDWWGGAAVTQEEATKSQKGE